MATDDCERPSRVRSVTEAGSNPMTTAGRTVARLTAITAICAAPLACSSASSQGATSPSDAAADRGAASLHDASLGGNDARDAGARDARDARTAAADTGRGGETSTSTTDAGSQRDGHMAVEGSASDGATDAGWALIWSDEFNEANGSAPDPTKWTTTSLGTATSGQGWGLEYDTPSANSIEDGNLVITATKAADGGIFSGAFDSKGKFQQAYGRFEARIQVAGGAGAWSAFWLMGDTNGQGWPTCGEIDIVETVSTTPDVTYGTVHSGNTSNASENTATGGTCTYDGGVLSAGYHVYAVEWSPDLVEFYFDGTLYKTDTPADLTQGEVWAFDHAFYVLFDLAIGGGWTGPPNAQTFPTSMKVDWVRVYAKAGG